MAEIDPRIRALYYMFLIGVNRINGDADPHAYRYLSSVAVKIWSVNDLLAYKSAGGLYCGDDIAKSILEDLEDDQD